jgi:hypothetical protein
MSVKPTFLCRIFDKISGLMKTFIFATVLSIFSLGIMSFDSTTFIPTVFSQNGFKVEIKKSPTYSGKELEAVYIIKCTSTTNAKLVRLFELIKSDARLKDYFIAEFVLIEKANPTKYYPLGWETTKIKVEDLKSDCLSILANDVRPVDINN